MANWTSANDSSFRSGGLSEASSSRPWRTAALPRRALAAAPAGLTSAYGSNTSSKILGRAYHYDRSGSAGQYGRVAAVEGGNSDRRPFSPLARPAYPHAAQRLSSGLEYAPMDSQRASAVGMLLAEAKRASEPAGRDGAADSVFGKSLLDQIGSAGPSIDNDGLTLDVRGRDMWDTSAQEIAKACTMEPRITAVDARHNSFSSAGGRVLGAAARDSSLSVLLVGGNRMGDGGVAELSAAAAGLDASSATVRSLLAGGAAHGASTSAPGGGVCALRQLDLSSNFVRSTGVAAIGLLLRPAVSPWLQALNLSENPLGADGAQRLTDALLGNASLRELRLRGCALGPRGCESVCSALCAHPVIARVDLARNGIRSAGVASVAEAVERCKSLTVLDISGQTPIGTADTSLQAARTPHASVSHSPSESKADTGAVASSSSALLLVSSTHRRTGQADDRAWKALANAIETRSGGDDERLTPLQGLSISACGLSDAAGGFVLQAAVSCRDLRLLDLGQNPACGGSESLEAAAAWLGRESCSVERLGTEGWTMAAADEVRVSALKRQAAHRAISMRAAREEAARRVAATQELEAAAADREAAAEAMREAEAMRDAADRLEQEERDVVDGPEQQAEQDSAVANGLEHWDLVASAGGELATARQSRAAAAASRADAETNRAMAERRLRDAEARTEATGRAKARGMERLSALQAERRRAEEEGERLRREAERHRQAARDADVRRQTLESELETMKQQVGEVEARVDSILGQGSGAGSERAVAIAGARKAREELSAAERAQRTADADLETIKGTVKDWREQLQAARDALASAESELGEAESVVMSCRRRQDAAVASTRRSERETASAQREVARLQSQVEGLGQDVSRVQRQARGLEEDAVRQQEAAEAAERTARDAEASAMSATRLARALRDAVDPTAIAEARAAAARNRAQAKALAMIADRIDRLLGDTPAGTVPSHSEPQARPIPQETEAVEQAGPEPSRDGEAAAALASLPDPRERRGSFTDPLPPRAIGSLLVDTPVAAAAATDGAAGAESLASAESTLLAAPWFLRLYRGYHISFKHASAATHMRPGWLALTRDLQWLGWTATGPAIDRADTAEEQPPERKGVGCEAGAARGQMLAASATTTTTTSPAFTHVLKVADGTELMRVRGSSVGVTGHKLPPVRPPGGAKGMGGCCGGGGSGQEPIEDAECFVSLMAVVDAKEDAVLDIRLGNEQVAAMLETDLQSLAATSSREQEALLLAAGSPRAFNSAIASLGASLWQPGGTLGTISAIIEPARAPALAAQHSPSAAIMPFSEHSSTRNEPEASTGDDSQAASIDDDVGKASDTPTAAPTHHEESPDEPEPPAPPAPPETAHAEAATTPEPAVAETIQSIMTAVPPEGADVPTVRLIRRMLWDQISIIPPNAPDMELPTYGQLRKAIEKRIGKQFDKSWRPWIRDTVDIMMDRCSAGLELA